MNQPVDIEPLLAHVQKAARYIGGEVGAVVKSPASVQLRVALCFPDVYEVAESHLGLKILYDGFNRLDGVQAERVYAPWPDFAALLERDGLPLFGLEARTPLHAFDVVGFSINHELAYAAVLRMLQLGKVPVRARARSDGDPIVLGGGPALCNPEPLAPFLDAVFVGEADLAVQEIARVLLDQRGRSRRDRLSALAQIEGVLLPDRHHPRFFEGRFQGFDVEEPGVQVVRARKVPDLEAVPTPERWIVPHLKPVHDRAAVEIQRGCTRGCRFCQAGMISRPTRQRDPGTVKRALLQTVQSLGADDAGLLSLSAGDYPMIAPLLGELASELDARRVSLSVPSLRSETLTPELARQLGRHRASGFTLAPEAATDRLRAVIAKNNSEDDLLRSVRAAIGAGARRVKLYFMIGLPTETDDDVLAIVDLAQRALREARALNRRAAVAVSVSTFVPKPHTPFQWEAQVGPDEVVRKQGLLRQALGRGRFELRWHDVAMSTVEGVYARGDRRLAEVLEDAVAAGAYLDGWTEHFDASRHLDALARQGLSVDDYLGPRDLDAPLPWDLVDVGVLRKFLLRERRDAYAALARADCVGDRCRACGACDFEQQRVIAYWPAVDTPVQRVEHPLHHRSNRDFQLPPPQASPSSPEAATGVEPELEPEGPLKDAQRPGDDRVQRLRLRFAKQPPAVHLSHLELMSTWQRALARSRLPVAFSGGFSARPRMSMPLALPVGMISDDELIDVDLCFRVDVNLALQLLQAQLPSGIVLKDGLALPPEAPGLGEILGGARYQAVVEGDLETVRQSLERFGAADSWPVQRERKGRISQVDLKTLLVAVELVGARLFYTLRSPVEGTVRPHEAWRSILGEDVTVHSLRKLQTLFAVDCEPGTTGDTGSR
ncbi:MAG: TIGR03960 family B12-binding radical SAM protein [Pseudomonadota bacterium]